MAKQYSPTLRPLRLLYSPTAINLKTNSLEMLLPLQLYFFTLLSCGRENFHKTLKLSTLLHIHRYNTQEYSGGGQDENE